MTHYPLRAGGTLRAGDFYIRRKADLELAQGLAQGELCLVLAPRQMGKSSMRLRVSEQLAEKGIRCLTVDLTALGGTKETKAVDWYRSFGYEITRQIEDTDLDIDEELAQNKSALPVRQLTLFLERLPKKLNVSSIVLFIDEIDALLVLGEWAEEFLRALRQIHNNRADRKIAEGISFCLLGVAIESDLLRSSVATSLNNRTQIVLQDFTREELRALEPILASSAENPAALVDGIFASTHGHPYMTQRLCASLVGPSSELPLPIPASKTPSWIQQVVEKTFINPTATSDPSLEYAKKYLSGISSHIASRDRAPKLLELYDQVLRGEKIPYRADNQVHAALVLSGAAAADSDSAEHWLIPRSQIFHAVLNQQWVESQRKDRYLHEMIKGWIESGKQADHLLSGRRLLEAERKLATQVFQRTPEEVEFLAASQRRQTRTRIIYGIIILLLSVLVPGIATYALFNIQKARSNAEISLMIAKSRLSEATAEREKARNELARAIEARHRAESELATIENNLNNGKQDYNVLQAKMAALTGSQSIIQSKYLKLASAHEKLSSAHEKLASAHEKLKEQSASIEKDKERIDKEYRDYKFAQDRSNKVRQGRLNSANSALKRCWDVSNTTIESIEDMKKSLDLDLVSDEAEKQLQDLANNIRRTIPREFQIRTTGR